MHPDRKPILSGPETHLHAAGEYESSVTVGVVRAEVCYGDPPGQEYRDLWVIRFAGDGRCTWFEKWPY